MSEAQMQPTVISPIEDKWVAAEGGGHDGLSVLAWSWLYPRLAAKRTARWGLKKCFLVHFVVGVMGAVVLPSSLVVFHESAAQLLDEFGDIAQEIERSPVEFVQTLFGLFLLIEFIHVALALVLSAWGGAATERLRDSLRWSLCQLWLRTPHAILVAFLIATALTTVEQTVKNWRTDHPDVLSTAWPAAPIPPSLPATDPNYAAAIKQYKQLQREWQIALGRARQSWMEQRRSEPWYVRNDEQLFIVFFVMAVGWWLAALLAALGARRALPLGGRSPLCLWCGYDLSMTAKESRCPECGEAVLSSLGADAQPGAAWEQRTPENRLRSWWRTWRAAVGKPVSFGRSLQLFGQNVDHRRFLVIHLIMIFLMGAAGAFSFAVMMADSMRDARDISLMVMIGFIFSIMCLIGAMLVTCGVASVAGWLISLQNRRNLLPAAMKVAAYASPYLVAWAFFGAVLINCSIYLEMEGWFRVASELTSLDRYFLFSMTVILPNLVCGLMFVVLVARGTRGARYANR